MITLLPAEHLPNRPFTHPHHTPREHEILRYMLEKLYIFLETILQYTQLFDIINHPEADGRNCRYVIPRPPLLALADNLAVVGFFGQKRLEAGSDHFGNLGEFIMRAIPNLPDILGYSNMELENGDFSNLVLLRGDNVKSAWLEGADHARAVDLSPAYYNTVRIYNGTLPGGVAAPRSLSLTKVKYYDFSCDPHWRGERKLLVLWESAGRSPDFGV